MAYSTAVIFIKQFWKHCLHLKKKTPVKTGRYTVSSIKNEGERSGGKRWGKGEKWKVMQFF